LLDYPQYTRPEIIAGITVPEVLLSGNHANIQQWRNQQSLGRTWEKRPDLLKDKQLSAEQELLLEHYIVNLRER
jgi:tRNA (guanine37-N1)-methyltransferase